MSENPTPPSNESFEYENKENQANWIHEFSIAAEHYAASVGMQGLAIFKACLEKKISVDVATKDFSSRVQQQITNRGQTENQWYFTFFNQSHINQLKRDPNNQVLKGIVSVFEDITPQQKVEYGKVAKDVVDQVFRVAGDLESLSHRFKPITIEEVEELQENIWPKFLSAKQEKPDETRF